MWSERFQDVYFSREDGLAESRHVFLDGNDLPAAWKDKPLFRIGETGFGTGLNFLAAWKMFAQTASPGQALSFHSVEKHPLLRSEIEAALLPWKEDLGDFLQSFLALYPENPKENLIEILPSPNVRLRILIGDASEEIPHFDSPMDSWFLDGFTPSKNPDMWSEPVFSALAERSRPGTTLGTFTVAGFVRRGLEQAGFSVEKTRGYGKKKDMLRGVFKETPQA